MDDYTELAPGFMGRVLDVRYQDGYGRALRLLRDGESLYFVHDQSVKKVPILVLDQAGFDDNYTSYYQGMSMSYQIAAAAIPTLLAILQDQDDGLFEMRKDS